MRKIYSLNGHSQRGHDLRLWEATRYGKPEVNCETAVKLAMIQRSSRLLTENDLSERR